MQDEERDEKFKNVLQACKENKHEKYIPLIQKLALEGDPKYMFYLATQYRDGIFLPQSIRHAEYWLRVATEKGYPDAIIALSDLRSGSGPPEDILKESRQILTRGVNRGFITQELMNDNMEELTQNHNQSMREFSKQMRREVKSFVSSLAGPAF